MNRPYILTGIKFLRVIIFNVVWVIAFISSCSQTRQPPNIILIMSDDVGYSDIGYYGSEIRTPNLDRLAGNGLRYTQFYNTARCCPTRASLITGLHPHQAGIGHMMEDRGNEHYQGFLLYRCHQRHGCKIHLGACHG